MFRLRRSIKISSKFNPGLRIEKGLSEPKIFSGGLIQSGGIIKDIWKPIVKTIDLKDNKKVLVLGMGGGTLINLLKNYNPQIKITAVEIDHEVIGIALKYFKIDKSQTQIVNEDAFKYISKSKGKFDVIFVDLYLGDKLPAESESQKFLEDLKKSLKPKGLVVFNRLYWGRHKKSAEDFIQILESLFAKVETKSVPQFFASNLMIFARNK